MATSAWVDWLQLPGDVSRRIAIDAMTGEGSYGSAQTFGASLHFGDFGNWGQQQMGNWVANNQRARRFDVPITAEFHPDADRMTPMERVRYASAAVGLAAAWFGGYKLTRSDVIDSGESSRKAVQLESAAQ